MDDLFNILLEFVCTMSADTHDVLQQELAVALVKYAIVNELHAQATEFTG